MNVIKRILNVLFNWFLVCWAQVVCICFCLFAVAHKIVEGDYPNETARKYVGMLLLGEEGIFQLDRNASEE